MKRFEIFDEESWTRSDPLSSCLSEEQVRHASRRTSLFLIDPASALWTVTNPTCRSRGFPRTLDQLQFAFWYSTFYTKYPLCPRSQAFVLYHEIFPDNPQSSVLTIAPSMKRNYGGKKVGPCEKQKLIVTHGRSMAVCNPIWSTEQTHRSPAYVRVQVFCKVPDWRPPVGVVHRSMTICRGSEKATCVQVQDLRESIVRREKQLNAYSRWSVKNPTLIFAYGKTSNKALATTTLHPSVLHRSINQLICCFLLNVSIVFAIWTF